MGLFQNIRKFMAKNSYSQEYMEYFKIHKNSVLFIFVARFCVYFPIFAEDSIVLSGLVKNQEVLERV